MEINPVVYGVLNYLINATEQDILALPLLKTDTKIDDLNICREAKDLIGFWSAIAQDMPACRPHKWSRYHIQSNNSSSWGSRRRRYLATAVQKIKHWRAFNGSYIDIKPLMTDEATWFVDPPYQVAGSHYKFGSKQIDYNHLAKWCESLPGQVIVCESFGATWLPFRPLTKTIGSGKKYRQGAKSIEVIWTKNCEEYPTLMR